MCVFSMLGTIMFLSKLIMEFLPNIHLVGTLIAVCTLVYRKKALIPIYIYVLLVGVYGGFNWWWMPYIYIWAISRDCARGKKIPITLYSHIDRWSGDLMSINYVLFFVSCVNISRIYTLWWRAVGMIPLHFFI
jgi:hypothetical protein